MYLVDVGFLGREMDVVKNFLADGAEELVGDQRLDDCMKVSTKVSVKAYCVPEHRLHTAWTRHRTFYKTLQFLERTGRSGICL